MFGEDDPNGAPVGPGEQYWGTDFAGPGDSLFGGFGNDSIYGQNGNDTILGAGNSDSIEGGSGNDSLLR